MIFLQAWSTTFSCFMGLVGDLGLLILLIVYSLIGATIFYFVERPVQLERIENEFRATNETIFSSAFDFCATYLNATNSSWHENVTTSCEDDLQDLLWKSYYTYHKDARGSSMEWNFGGAAVYAGTLYTTIGYGNLAPVTVMGRSITMVYALLGIPLLLVILARCGFHASMFINWIWRGLTSLTRQRKQSVAPERQAEVHFPITLALVLTMGWLLGSSALFLIWEDDWDYFTCFYFSFISLTTIGLGDVTPTRPETMLINFVFILLGLSLLSMCINLIQTKIEAIATEVMELIRNRYKDSQLDTENMSQLHCEAEVDELLSKHSQTRWLAALVKRKHKAEITNYFEEKAKMVLAGTQTDNTMHNAACSATVCTSEAGTQDFNNNVSGPDATAQTNRPLVGRLGRYQDEIDDFRATIRRVDHLLADCRDILRN